LNAIISSILMTRRPDEVRMLLIDPKMVELSGYARLPHLMHPVVTDMRKAEAILAWAVEKMEERYALLARAGVRHISSYNQLGEAELYERLEPENDEERAAIPVHLPFIVIVADEMADLMMTSGKEVEQHIIRLAQKSRAVGIHLIMATQKPTVDVITGLIKSNLPARIAFQVSSRTDSRVVLDEMGADKLLGNGDMLFLWPGTSTLLRGQGTYLSDDEIERIVDCVSTGEQHFVHELVHLKVETAAPGGAAQLEKRDELYESAIDIVVREGRGSVSLLQRALGIGYGRAARLIDFMAEDGIVGAYAGSQAREVVISLEDWEQMQAASREGGGLVMPAVAGAAAGSAGSAGLSGAVAGAIAGSIGGASRASSGPAFVPAAKSPPVPTASRPRRNRIVPKNGWGDDDEEEDEQDGAPEDELDDEYEDDEVAEVQNEDENGQPDDYDEDEVEDDEDDDVSDFDEDDEDEEDEEYDEDEEDEYEEDELNESESEEKELEDDAEDDDDEQAADRRHGAHRKVKPPRTGRTRIDQPPRSAR
jgi:S-DNA-T family DNA segregation ATPase FtsK/SpoIIIE